MPAPLRKLYLGDYVARYIDPDRVGAYIAIGPTSGPGDDLCVAREEAMALARFLTHWAERCDSVAEWVGNEDAERIRAGLADQGWLDAPGEAGR